MVLIRPLPSSVRAVQDAGRTPAHINLLRSASGEPIAFSSVDAFDERKPLLSNTIPGKAKEIMLSALSTRLTPNININLPVGVALAIKFLEQAHLSNDTLVTEDKIKAAHTQYLLSLPNVREVVWFETGGALELGCGFKGTIPVAPFVGVNAGFRASGLVGYRQIQPVAIKNAAQAVDILKSFCPLLPFSAKLARKMPMGSEFALTGEGRLGLSGKLSVDAGKNIMGMIARVAYANCGMDAQAVQTYQINVLALDGSQKIRVTLSQILNWKIALVGSVAAGLDVHFPAFLPAVGEGILQTIVENPSKDIVESFFDNFTKAEINAELSTQETRKELCIFEIDLSEKQAAGAYQSLLKLCPKDAINLSLKKDSGVKLVKVIEKEFTDQESIDIQFLGAKLLLVHALDLERQGLARRIGGPKISYRETGFNKQFTTWFTGDKKVLWETVALQEDTEKPSRRYFRFQFTGKDYLTQQKDVDWFFRFADLLGVERIKDVSAALPQMDTISSFLSAADDTSSEVDIYFTEESIDKIACSSFQSAFYAFSNAMAYLDPKYRTIPWLQRADSQTQEATRLLLEVENDKNNDFLTWITCRDKETECSEEYKRLCNRDLGEDLAFYREAEAFALALEEFKTTSSLKVFESWFARLGKKQGFDFMATIAALHHLAGPGETLVHRLNLRGGGTCLESIDEGFLQSPAALATDLLA